MTGAEYCELAERIPDTAQFDPEGKMRGAVARFFRELDESAPEDDVLGTDELLALKDDKGRPLLLPDDFEHTTISSKDIEPARDGLGNLI